MTWKIHDIATRYDGSEVLVLTETGNYQLVTSFICHDPAHPVPWMSQSINDGGEVENDMGRKFDASILLNAIQKAWSQLQPTHPLKPEGVLRLSVTQGTVSGALVQETSEYARYCSTLQPVRQVIGRERAKKRKTTDFVRYDAVQTHEVLGGVRANSRGANMRSCQVSQQRLVYKGLSFFKYLTYGPEVFSLHVDVLYYEIKMVNMTLPPHPNIVRPPMAFVVAAPDEAEPDEAADSGLVVGTLSVFLEQGSLASVLTRAARDGRRIPLERKAKWCYQLASAMVHTHFEALSWHLDLKPTNVLVDADDNILVIDWEHCGTNPFVLAPEADGFYEIDTSASSESHLVYVPYEGPDRVNMPLGVPRWTSFPEWKQSFPRAVELAEVFSLGRSMFLILEEVERDPADKGDDYISTVMAWTSRSTDIPLSWKQTIDDCVHQDPNQRLGMKALSAFWESEWVSLQQSAF